MLEYLWGCFDLITIEDSDGY